MTRRTFRELEWSCQRTKWRAGYLRDAVVNGSSGRWRYFFLFFFSGIGAAPDAARSR